MNVDLNEPPEDAELVDRSARIRDALRDTEWTRPLFIELTGTPKSGKSSCIDNVSHFFRRSGYKVLAPTEGVSKRTPYFLKENLTDYNAWSACYALMHVLEGLHHSDQHDIAILDRGLFDALVWFELLTTQGQIDPADCDAIHNFLLLPRWREALDLVVLFLAEPVTSMRRENEGRLIAKRGRAMNPEFLGQLNVAYESVRSKYSDAFSTFAEIRTDGETGVDQREAARQVVELILGKLEMRLAVGNQNG